MKGVEERVQLSTLRCFSGEIKEKEKKEEKNEAKALPNCDRNRLLHRSSFVIWLVFVLRIWIRSIHPQGSSLLLCVSSSHSSTINDHFSSCKVSFNQSLMS